MPGSVKKAITFLSLCFLFILLAQHAKTQNKIDLPFQMLIANQKIADSISLKKGHSKKMTGRKKLPADSLVKKYECVIYTSNPAALRKMGIVLQSELPGFITALATLKQIELAAAIPEVTFIKAPDNLNMHNK